MGKMGPTGHSQPFLLLKEPLVLWHVRKLCFLHMIKLFGKVCFEPATPGLKGRCFRCAVRFVSCVLYYTLPGCPQSLNICEALCSLGSTETFLSKKGICSELRALICSLCTCLLKKRAGAYFVMSPVTSPDILKPRSILTFGCMREPSFTVVPLPMTTPRPISEGYISTFLSRIQSSPSPFMP